MAQLTKTSSQASYAVSTMQSTLNALITAIAAGKQINAADIVTLKTATYDAFRLHTHTVVDTIGIDGAGAPHTYGTAPGQTTVETSSVAYQGSSGTSGYGAQTTPGGVTSGNQIYASDINAIITMINTMAAHYHTVTDQVGTAGLPTPHLTTGLYFGSTGSGTTETLTFNTNGTLVATTVDSSYGAYSTTVSNQWIINGPLPSGAASNYEIQVTVGAVDTGSGSENSGGASYNGSFPATGAWTNMGSGGTVSAYLTAVYVETSTEAGTAITNLPVYYSIRAVGSTTVLASGSVTLESQAGSGGGGGCCFPAGSQVLMADCSWKAIENVVAGDLVMGMGKPETITEVTRPILGRRRMMTFADGSIQWSEEHAFWTKDDANTQWWWSVNPAMWRSEVISGVIGGLTDNNSIRSMRNVAAWAHTSGWKENTVAVVPDALPTEQLYLPRTSGSPIIVNGYVVGAGVNQSGYDYTTLDWNTVQANLPTIAGMPA